MPTCTTVCGNITSATILLSADVLTSCLTGCARGLADVVNSICGSGQNTARRKVAWHKQRYANKPVYVGESPSLWGSIISTGEGESAYDELDVEATMAGSTFPIKPYELIAMAKDIIASEFGTKEGFDGSCLADDFQFVAPIVGPLTKAEFLRAFGSFKLKEAIPDIKANSWFHVDPLEPNRVWFFSRTTGTHTGTLNFGRPIPATGKEFQCPPQAQSMLFDENGKCYTITVGYCMDKRIGNTNGLGGVFAIMYGIGKPLPFPEAKALYNPSLRYEAFEHVAKAMEAMGIDPATQKRLPAKVPTEDLKDEKMMGA